MGLTRGEKRALAVRALELTGLLHSLALLLLDEGGATMALKAIEVQDSTNALVVDIQAEAAD